MYMNIYTGMSNLIVQLISFIMYEWCGFPNVQDFIDEYCPGNIYAE